MSRYNKQALLLKIKAAPNKLKRRPCSSALHMPLTTTSTWDILKNTPITTNDQLKTHESTQNWGKDPDTALKLHR
jgi:hypothetical protein